MSSSGNQREISLSAFSGVSEAWTKFLRTLCSLSAKIYDSDDAKSPRIVPGSADFGSVAPAIFLACAIAFSPSRIKAIVGPSWSIDIFHP